MADENTGKIYIIVTDKLPSGETPTPEGIKNPAEKKDPDSLFAHWAKNQILGLIKQTAVQQINYSLNNIGNFTGNYELQTQVGNARKALNILRSIGSSTIAGAQVGSAAGPWGAAIGAAIGLLTSGVSASVSLLQEHNSLMIQNRKTNNEIAILRERSGLNQYTDGSRGTLY